MEVTEIIQRTYNVKSFRFATKGEVNFLAGQFFFVTIKIEGKEATKPFSISNSPTEKGYIEFTKKLTGSDFSQALNTLKIGDWARLRLAYGQFTPLQVRPKGAPVVCDDLLVTGQAPKEICTKGGAGEYSKIAFLSGGIGITPIRSICKFATDKKVATNITLLYSNNTPEDIVFKEEFEEMERINKNLKVVHTISWPDSSRSWRGRTGRIDAGMIKEEIPDYLERVFYICGPPGMVEAMKEILIRDLKLNLPRIKTENFTGYE